MFGAEPLSKEQTVPDEDCTLCWPTHPSVINTRPRGGSWAWSLPLLHCFSIPACISALQVKAQSITPTDLQLLASCFSEQQHPWRSNIFGGYSITEVGGIRGKKKMHEFSFKHRLELSHTALVSVTFQKVHVRKLKTK